MLGSFRDKKEVAPPAPAPAPKVEAPPPPKVEAAPANACVLGPTLQFKGDLYGEEDLDFRAQIEGTIEHTRNLTIGKEGGVKGNIRAKVVVVEGTVNGDIYASESCSVRVTAKIIGNIFSPRVGLADGANFNGRIDMSASAAAAKPAPQTSASLTDVAAERLLHANLGK
jgi:cytoskeletal protein CcmA (bactofilin family)